MSATSALETPSIASNRSWFEKRIEPRHNCRKLVRIRPVTTPESSFRLSLVQDVSANGIGLLLSNQVAPGALLEVEVEGRSCTRRFARVMHCTKHEGGWLVGCQLNHSLSDSEMEKLLI